MEAAAHLLPASHLTDPSPLPLPLPQVHLVVDTVLTSKRFNVQGYTSKVLTLGDKSLAAEFVEVAVEVLFADVEKVGGAWQATTAAVAAAVAGCQACACGCCAAGHRPAGAGPAAHAWPPAGP